MTLNPRTFDAYNLFHQGTLALARAERQGIRVDVDYVERKKVYLTRKIERMERKFMESPFFQQWQDMMDGKANLNSPPQLSKLLYKIKKIKVQKETASGAGATDKEALQQLNIPELNDLLEIRGLKKLRDTYLETFIREQTAGYIHPFFNLHLVRTFRSSANNPNFQNLPKRDEEAMQLIRKALYPRKGHQLLEIDYSGLEVRISACYNKDETLLRYIKNPASDMHGDMAKQIFMLDKFDKSLPEHHTLRQAAKNGFVFPEFYGDYYINCASNMACSWGKLPKGKWKPGEGIPMPEGTLADHMISKGIKSLKSFETYLQKIETDFWENRFPDYAKWKERWWNLYKKYGYVDLLTGFRCSGVMRRNDVTNYPVQGAAFHCLLWSFIELDRIILEEKLDTRVIGQIHDSILLDVNPDERDYIVETVKRVTCKDLPAAWKWIIVPLEIDIEICEVDSSWADKNKYRN